MKLDLYQQVVVVRNVAEANLKQGDVATLVDYVPHPSGGEEGAVLEVFNAIGESVAVVTVPVSAISPLSADQLPTVRNLQAV
jgi:hypothetical protein